MRGQGHLSIVRQLREKPSEGNVPRGTVASALSKLVSSLSCSSLSHDSRTSCSRVDKGKKSAPLELSRLGKPTG